MFCCFSKPHIENFFCQWSIISSRFPNSVKNGIDRLYTDPILRFDHINLLSLNNTIYVGNFYYLENNWRAHFAESRHLWVHTFNTEIYVFRGMTCLFLMWYFSSMSIELFRIHIRVFEYLPPFCLEFDDVSNGIIRLSARWRGSG